MRATLGKERAHRTPPGRPLCAGKERAHRTPPGRPLCAIKATRMSDLKPISENRLAANREYRRSVVDFDRLKVLRHRMPDEANVGLEPEPEDIVPHRRPHLQSPTHPAPAGRPQSFGRFQPSSAPVSLLPPNALSSPPDSTSVDPALPAEPAYPSRPQQSLPAALPNPDDRAKNSQC